MYREMLGETPATASQPAKKKATKKKSTPKKKKVSESDIDKMKAQIKQRTGKTEEECEKIVDEYRALRKKATTRKKKETATKEKSKQRTTKLKKEGKVIEGTTEKNVEATIDTATKTATKKVDKEITKIEKSTKGEKQVEKKIDQLVKKALASSKKFVSDMAKELSTKSKTDGKTYLLGLRSQIDALLKKYELGGEVFDGSGDSINFGSGGFTSSYNIQDGMISVGNNVKFEEGGKINTFNSEKDYENYLRKEGKPFDEVVIDKVKYIQDFYDRSGNTMTYRSKKGNQLEIENEDRYENGFGDSKVYINEGMYTPYDEYEDFAKGGMSVGFYDEGQKSMRFQQFDNREETKKFLEKEGMKEVKKDPKTRKEFKFYSKGGKVDSHDIASKFMDYKYDGHDWWGGDSYKDELAEGRYLGAVQLVEFRQGKGDDIELISNLDGLDRDFIDEIMSGERYAKGGKVYSIDIDTQDGNEIRDFQYTHNEFGLHQATEYFNKLKARGIVEYNDKGHLISNIQLLEVDEKGDYKVLDSKFFDEFEQGGEISEAKLQKMLKDDDVSWSSAKEFFEIAKNRGFDYDYDKETFVSTKTYNEGSYSDKDYAKGGMSQGYNDRLDESLGSRRGTSMSHHQNYKDRRDESKGMETGMGRRAYRGVNTMDNN